MGLGYCSPPIEKCNEFQLWDAMLTTIKGVTDFLPVTDVVWEDKPDYLWRSMKFAGPGPMNGKTIIEKIYADRKKGEIRFVDLDASGKETGSEVINALLKSPPRIEYYQRSTTTKERVHWLAPQVSIAAAIEKTVVDAQTSPKRGYSIY